MEEISRRSTYRVTFEDFIKAFNFPPGTSIVDTAVDGWSMSVDITVEFE